MQNHTSNKRLNTGKTQTKLGRALQDCPLLKIRELSSGIDGWEEITTPMEH